MKKSKPSSEMKSSVAKPTILAAAWDWVKSMAFGLLLFLTLRAFAIQTYSIISGSMENTFLIGDFVLVNKVAYGATIPLSHARLPGVTSPKRGDAVVFHSNHDTPQTLIVKRLIGLPGDTVAMNAGILIVNGKTQSEPYVKHVDPTDDSIADPTLLWQRQYLVESAYPTSYLPSRETWGPLVVPREQYFMMGDNRDQSYDSRWWGFVKKQEIIGRADLIYFSWEKGIGPRLNRVGRIVRRDR